MIEIFNTVITLKDIIVGLAGIVTVLGLVCGWFKKGLGITSIESQISHIKRDTIRIQLLYLWQHDPKNVDAICSLYDDYIKLGGNSYIVEMYEQWKKKHLLKK